MTAASDIEAAAADWLVRLDNLDQAEPPPAEFIAWCERDPRHRAAYLRLEAAWRKTDRLRQVRAFDRSVDADLLARSPRTAAGRRVRRLWPVAAAVSALAVGLALAAWVVGERGQVYRTGIGGFERIVLEDGSTVELDTDSEIRVRFEPGRRRVALVHGQGHFKVAHDSGRPFDVTAGATTVRAVGTAFAVRLRDPFEIEVLVTEGRVAIASQERDLSSIEIPPELPTLSAGEIAVIKPNLPRLESGKIESTDIVRQLAWTEGRLMFEGQTLGEAVAEFNRYNKRQLTIEDASVAALRVGGSFKATDPESFVVALEKSFGVRVAAAEPDVIVLARQRE